MLKVESNTSPLAYNQEMYHFMVMKKIELCVFFQFLLLESKVRSSHRHDSTYKPQVRPFLEVTTTSKYELHAQ